MTAAPKGLAADNKVTIQGKIKPEVPTSKLDPAKEDTICPIQYRELTIRVNGIFANVGPISSLLQFLPAQDNRSTDTPHLQYTPRVQFRHRVVGARPAVMLCCLKQASKFIQKWQSIRASRDSSAW